MQNEIIVSRVEGGDGGYKLLPGSQGGRNVKLIKSTHSFHIDRQTGDAAADKGRVAGSSYYQDSSAIVFERDDWSLSSLHTVPSASRNLIRISFLTGSFILQSGWKRQELVRREEDCSDGLKFVMTYYRDVTLSRSSNCNQCYGKMVVLCMLGTS